MRAGRLLGVEKRARYKAGVSRGPPKPTSTPPQSNKTHSRFQEIPTPTAAMEGLSAEERSNMATGHKANLSNPSTLSRIKEPTATPSRTDFVTSRHLRGKQAALPRRAEEARRRGRFLREEGRCCPRCEYGHARQRDRRVQDHPRA